MKFSYPQWNFHYPQRCNIHYHDESFITPLTQMKFSIPHSSTRYFKHLLLLLNSLWEWVALCVSLYEVKSVIARPITKQSLSLQSWKKLSLAMTDQTWTAGLFVCLFVPEFSLTMSCFLCITICKVYHQLEPFFEEFGKLLLAMTAQTWQLLDDCLNTWWLPDICVSIYKVKTMIARPMTNRFFLAEFGIASWMDQ